MDDIGDAISVSSSQAHDDRNGNSGRVLATHGRSAVSCERSNSGRERVALRKRIAVEGWAVGSIRVGMLDRNS